MESDSKASEYNRRYYEKHKDEISAWRKDRYKSDPSYRQSAIEASRKRRQRIAAERRLAKEQGSAVSNRKYTPREFLIEVRKRHVKVEMYPVGLLAQKLSRRTQTIHMWERTGKFPGALYRSQGKFEGRSGDRLYTAFQIKEIEAAYRRAIRDFGPETARNRISKTAFFKEVWIIWRTYPLGIDTNDIGE